MRYQESTSARILFSVWTTVALLAAGGGAFASSSGPRDGHEAPACDACHLRTATEDRGAGLLVPNERCIGCHDQRAATGGAASAFHGSSRRACVDCHSFHRPEELKAGDTTFAHVFGESGAGKHCVACHAGSGGPRGLGEAHRDAAAVYHGNGAYLAGLTPSEGCLLCHSRDGADAVALRATSEPPRFREHSSHPYGAEVLPGRSTGGFRIRRDPDARLTLFDGRMECQTCHDITDDAPDLLVRYAEPYDLCLGCHQRTVGGPSMVAGSTPAAPSGERPTGLSE